MHEPIYSLREFSEKVGVSYGCILWRAKKPGNNFPEAIKLKTNGAVVTRRLPLRYKYSDLMEWHLSFNNEIKLKDGDI
jgi:hypothetical protein